jgi:hypothetical protein
MQKQQTSALKMLQAKLFDRYARWENQFAPVLKRPQVPEALHAVMSKFCKNNGLVKVRENGKSFYGATSPRRIRTGHPVELYRYWEQCHTINILAGALGQEAVPELTFRGTGRLEHSSAIGINHGRVGAAIGPLR